MRRWNLCQALNKLPHEIEEEDYLLVDLMEEIVYQQGLKEHKRLKALEHRGK
jgi:hypothetical protein